MTIEERVALNMYIKVYSDLIADANFGLTDEQKETLKARIASAGRRLMKD